MAEIDYEPDHDPDKSLLEARIELLEDDIASRLSELDKAGERIRWLEAENERLKRENESQRLDIMVDIDRILELESALGYHDQAEQETTPEN